MRHVGARLRSEFLPRALRLGGELGTLGANVVVGGSPNANEDPVEFTSIGGTNTVTYDNTHVHSGNLAIASFLPAGGASASAAFGWTNWHIYNQTCYGRFYFYFTAAGSSGPQIIRWTSGGNVLAGGARLTTTPTIQAMNSSNVLVGSASATIPTNQWIRVEQRIYPDPAAGIIQTRAWWTNPDGTGTPDYDNTATSVPTGAGMIDGVQFGVGQNLTMTANFTIWFDDMAAPFFDWPGPVASHLLSSGLTDTALSFSDSLVSTRQRTISDTALVFTEALVTTRQRTLNDTALTFSDSVTATLIPGGRSYSYNVSDTALAFSDTLVSNRLRAISDQALSFSETLVTTRQRTISETALSFSDLVVSTRQRTVTDTALSFGESLRTTRQPTVSDTALSFSDMINPKTTQRNVTDTALSLSDSLVRTVSRVVADTALSLSETLQTTRQRAVTDVGLSFSDTLVTTRQRAIADTALVFSDSVATPKQRVVSDTALNFSDVLASTRQRSISDTALAFSDVVQTARQRPVSDNALSFSDSVGSTRLRSVVDTGLSFSDSVGRQPVSRPISDSALSFSETLLSTRQRTVTDWALGGFGASDTFTRTVAAATGASWGTVDSGGQTWANIGTTTGCTYSVNGSAAVNSTVAGNAARRGETISLGSPHQEILAEFALDAIPVGAAYFHSVLLRAADANNMYSADLSITTTGNIQTRLRRIVAGTGTIIVAAANVPGIGTYTAGTYLWARARIEGDFLAVKAWKDGTSEPSAWTMTTLDTTLTSGSLGGVGGQGNASITNALNQSIDNVNATSIAADTLLTTRQRTLTDTALSFSDTLVRGVVRSVADQALSFSDVVSPSRSFQRAVIDTGLAFSDTLVRTLIFRVADTALSFGDSVSTGRTKTISDTGLSFSDTLAHTSLRRVLDQAVSFSDALATLRAREIFDTGLVFADSVAIARGPLLTDTALSLSDFVVVSRPSTGAPPILAQII